MNYDAIVVGASFAGLAVVNQLRGRRVLLIDRKPVGSGQTSACGTILRVLEYWGVTEAVLQTHDHIVLHTAEGVIEFPSPYPWCTFDYRQLCQTLFARAGVEFLQASAQETHTGQVVTDHGRFNARCVVDASGWQARLASSRDPDFARRDALNFGIETICPTGRVPAACPTQSLHFWYNPDILANGIGWAFPRGEAVSIGLGSYRGPTRLRQPLTQFTQQFDLRSNGMHGNCFPHTLRPPIAGSIFVVGDAAGMCIALTGEGIRPALFFGEACGRIVRRVIEGELTPAAGLAAYAAFVEKRRRFFKVFSAAQLALPRLPTLWIDQLIRLLHHDRVRPWLLDKYWGLTREWN